MSALNNENKKNPQTIADFLFFAKNCLKNVENQKLESELLLSFVLKKERICLKTNPDYLLTKKEVAKFREILEKRKNNTPVAYILGYKIWNDLKIEVSPDVLIPRDETELLANYILENPSLGCARDKLNYPKSILDIGTGSGCLAIFLAKKWPKATVFSTDISSEALKVAKKNAKNHNVKINFVESDLLKNIPFVNSLPARRGERKGVFKIPRNFDTIVANLPYVPTNIEVAEDVKKEPYLAIFSGEDGLDLIRKLAEQLKSCEISFQELWLEFLPQQKEEIAKIFAGFSVEFYPDLGGDIYFAKIS